MYIIWKMWLYYIIIFCEVCILFIIPLFCFFKETEHRTSRIFLEDLYTSLDAQEWLDVQCLDQVISNGLSALLSVCHIHANSVNVTYQV